MLKHRSLEFSNCNQWGEKTAAVNQGRFAFYLTAREDVELRFGSDANKMAFAEIWYETTRFKFWILRINDAKRFGALIFDHEVRNKGCTPFFLSTYYMISHLINGIWLSIIPGMLVSFPQL